MTTHDERCEADWNDGICACPERAIPRVTLPEVAPTTFLQRVALALRL